MNKKDKLWFASAGSMAQVPLPGAIVSYFPKGHAEHVGVEFHLADSRAQMISCQVSELTLFANPATNEPVAKIGLVPVDPSLDQGYGKIHRDDIVDYPLSYKTLTSSDANGPLSVLKHCVNTIFPPMDSESEEQTILANDISGISWEFRHTFKRAQSQDHLRGDWRRFVNNNQLKRGDSIVFVKAEADEVLVGIAKELSRIERATSVSHEVSMAYSRAPFEVLYYPRAAGPQFCVGISDVMKALNFRWEPGMLFRKAFETKDAGGIKWFEGSVTSVYHNDPWYNLKVQWKHSDRNENFVSPWTVEPLNPPISLPRQPPAPPQGPSGPQGRPDSQNSGPGNVTGVEFFPKQHILQGETSKFREEQQRQAECQREYDGPESALLIIDDTQQDQDGSFEVLPVKVSQPSKVTSTSGAYKKIDSRSLCFAGHAEDVCEAVSGIVVPKHLSSEIGSTVPSGDAVGELSVFQLIQAYQEKAARLPLIEEIRTVLDHSLRGVLSTFSHKHEGYPSGSMVDFACDAYGYPILAISSLEVHTKDILSNPKCSLLVAKDPQDRTDLKITVHGDAISVSEKDREAIRTAYLARHPGAFWVDFGHFQFIRIEPKVVRFVSGVATASLGSGEFSKEEYRMAKVDPIFQFSKPVASHMNRDHAEDTKLIVQHLTSIPVDSAHMLDLDSLGFNVKAGYQGSTFKLRIPFPRRATDRMDVKTLIVEMLLAATPQVD